MTVIVSSLIFLEFPQQSLVLFFIILWLFFFNLLISFFKLFFFQLFLFYLFFSLHSKELLFELAFFFRAVLVIWSNGVSWWITFRLIVIGNFFVSFFKIFSFLSASRWWSWWLIRFVIIIVLLSRCRLHTLFHLFKFPIPYTIRSFLVNFFLFNFLQNIFEVLHSFILLSISGRGATVVHI